MPLPSGFQILASPSAEEDSKEGGEPIHDKLETAAECPFQAVWKPDDGTAKLYPPAAFFLTPLCSCLADITEAITIAKHARTASTRRAVEAYPIQPIHAP